MSRSSVYRRLARLFKEQGRQVGAPCWLCGGAIDYDTSRQKLSHSVDHVKPVSLYPELENDVSNMRHAHYGCNSSRGNREAVMATNRLLYFD